MNHYARALLLTICLLSAAGLAVPAPPEADLMGTASCKLARDRFDAAFAQASKLNPPTSSELEEARKAAAVACFGKAASGPSAPSGTRSPQPTVVVPQAAAARRLLPTTPAPSAQTQGPVEIGRPGFITTCDPNGCWGSDGSRLNRVGPDLSGPRGACMVQGGVTTCP